MNIREKLAQGIFEEKPQPLLAEPVAWEAPEDNFFQLKNKTKLNRMVKSTKARAYRHMIRAVKQKRHDRGYNGTTS